MDIQRELIANQQRTEMYEGNIMYNKKSVQKSAVTIKELESLSEHHLTFAPVGKEDLFLFC